MASVFSPFAFTNDYSGIASCLNAIYSSSQNGAFNGNERALYLIRLLDKDAVKKLYSRTLQVLGIIDGVIDPPTNEKGDYEEDDFSSMDFYVSFQDSGNAGFGSNFQTVLNIFEEFKDRYEEITEEDKQRLDEVLIPFLDAFDELQQYLDEAGLNTCSEIELGGQNNTAEIFLQAAGSDGSNDIPSGIHLRWSLDGVIGENHIPKGNLASGTSNFNRPDDFVRLFRIPYVNPAIVTLDFETAKPTINYLNGQWTYVINSLINGVACTNRLRLTFRNREIYKQLASEISPLETPYAFLSLYSDIIDIEIVYKHAFSIRLAFLKNAENNSANIKIETQNKSAEVLAGARVNINLDNNNPGIEKSILGDNISRVRMKKSAGGILKSFSFETYDDFLATRAGSDWVMLNNELALNLTDSVVFDRLENAAYPIDNLWPQYNEGTRVRVANYQDKWNVPHDNVPTIKQAVQRYLELGNTDPKAEDVFYKPDATEEDSGVVISYLDVLNMVASDYHFARMFGLGYIDVLPNADPSERFIYKVEYTNRKNVQSSEVINFRSLSIPTSKMDFRAPDKPVARPVSYKFQDDSSANTTLDANGYSSVYDARIINIGRKAYPSEIAQEDFFGSLAPWEDYNIFERSEPVTYGIEYRSAGQSSYVRPEITSDGSFGFEHYAYQDGSPQGVPETVPVPDNPDSLYIHFERNSGIHYYAIYGINWFSRISVIGEEVATDATQFPKKNALLPPIDISVQYIQQEDTLLFTTQGEQDWLKGRAAAFEGADVSFTRITFNWLDVVDLSHLRNIQNFQLNDVVKADRVNVYFKPAEPLQLSGSISDIVPVPGTDAQCLVYTRPVTLIDGSVSELDITSEQAALFTGSLLSTEEGQFAVRNVQLGAEGPVFTLDKISENISVEDEENENTFASEIRYSQPNIDERFTVTENLSAPGNWDALSAHIALIDFVRPADPEIETAVDGEGNLTYALVGGITANATVIPLPAANGGPILPGYYQVSFAPGTTLQAHPQVNLPFNPSSPLNNSPLSSEIPHVEWYKGLIRIPVLNSIEKKLLEVIRIVSLSPLVLYVYDPNDEDAPIQVSNGNQLIEGLNFHPGYRAYLFTEPDDVFNRTSIEPANGVNMKKSMLGLQSEDTGGSGFASRVSMPAVLMAALIEKPEKPELPTYFGLRVRPDETGRAAFTFDVKVVPAVSGLPFGYTFFRANLDDVLYALYKAETVDEINSRLDELTEDPFADQRLFELVNLVFDPSSNGQFRVYDAEPAPYGFPQPDRTGISEPADSLEIRIAKYTAAIRATLLPLNEQTPILAYIKQGLQTDNKVPRIRNIDGVLLNPGSPDFDPFPMIRKYTSAAAGANTTYVRFTDYSLIASSRNRYFYSAAGTTNQLVIGPLSTFVGPVTIVQTTPPPAPVLKDYNIDISGVITDSPLAINFRVNPVSEVENISKIRLYRTADESKVYSLEAMSAYLESNINDGSVLNTIETTDTLEGLDDIPFGDKLYYRLAFVRDVINELNEPEEIISFPSEITAVPVIDTSNPEAPDIMYAADTNTLSWFPTIKKGKYYLFKQNDKGNWEKIFTYASSSADEITYAIPEPLELTDEDGNRIYHRFKVRVENSSGLFNLVEKELTI